LHWRPQFIVDEIHCELRTIYEIQENMFIYGSTFKSRRRVVSDPRKVHRVVEKFLIAYLEEQP